MLLELAICQLLIEDQHIENFTLKITGLTDTFYMNTETLQPLSQMKKIMIMRIKIISIQEPEFIRGYHLRSSGSLRIYLNLE